MVWHYGKLLFKWAGILDDNTFKVSYKKFVEKCDRQKENIKNGVEDDTVVNFMSEMKLDQDRLCAVQFIKDFTNISTE